MAATVSSVSGSASSVALFAANGAARQRMVFNDSTAVLYLKYGTTASTASYTAQIPAGGYFELPGNSVAALYQDVVHGIWSAATGAALCTEVT